MKFLVDAQLPPALAQWLREAGHESIHVAEVGLRDANDDAIWRRAIEHGMVIVTKDEDFATRAAQTSKAPAIVWLRVGNSTNPALRAWMTERLPGITGMLDQGNGLIEVI